MAADTESRIAALESRIDLLESKLLLQAFEVEALETALAHLPNWPNEPEPLGTLIAAKRPWVLQKIADLAELSPQTARRIRELDPELR